MNQTTLIPRIAYRAVWVVILCGAAAFLGVTLQLSLWWLDNKPPFLLIAYTVSPTERGDLAILRVNVKRDLSRDCSVTYSRMFYDAEGTRTELTPDVQLMTAEAINDLDARTPDKLVITVRVPKEAAKGLGAVVTPLEYVCNPLHQLYPIHLLLRMNLEVL